MIIRLYETTETSLVKARISAPGDASVEFGTINLLMFSSVELRQRFGLRIAETDARNITELVQGLTECDGQRTGAEVEESRLAKLLEVRPSLLPCFIAYQENPAGKLLPIMTDGLEDRWSLFLAQDGAMTLVELSQGQWRISTEEELLPEMMRRSDPIAETKSFLLNGIRSARKMLVRPGDGG
jgi:hypothetical protein